MSEGLSKLTITSLADEDEAFELLINPESLKLSRKVKYTDDKTQGTSADVNRFEGYAPSTLSFSFILDSTGVAYDKTESIEDTIESFEGVVYEYVGDNHQPNPLKISWGNFTFNCRLQSLDYEYTLFSSTGEPLRVKVSVSFVSYVTRVEEQVASDKSSPDLSHVVTLKAGESIPLWCYRIYKDPSYCTDIARYNGLDNFRNVKPGTRLLFPPLVRNG
ncbi:MAG: hypothetical protein LUG98_10925 [Tannerellaceae bacterium]|nr:hypothetical protein [Tannerellaceae bacterium]